MHYQAPDPLQWLTPFSLGTNPTKLITSVSMHSFLVTLTTTTTTSHDIKQQRQHRRLMASI